MSGPGSPPGDLTGPRGVEEVLVVPRAVLLARGLLVQGFSPFGAGGGGWERCLEAVGAAGRFVPRPQAEEDASLKQIIPYAVVTCGERVFLFRRTARGGESRLHGKWSIGVGGHVNPEGVAVDRVVEAGLRRELEEELAFDLPYSFRPVGLINDDQVPVGRVHLGIVFRVLAGSEGVTVREDLLMEGGFVPRIELEALLPFMETWSRLVAEAIFFSPGGGEAGVLDPPPGPQ